ncbi:MAG: hypothetical protein IH916_01340, partial [Acidobacteria bacterium]|nr:hypothetical protein [Acidobacteriota bacterium]
MKLVGALALIAALCGCEKAAHEHPAEARQALAETRYADALSASEAGHRGNPTATVSWGLDLVKLAAHARAAQSNGTVRAAQDNSDVEEATRRGVLVGNTPGVLAKATADIAFGLLMSAARRISESDRWLRAGKWELQFHPMSWLGAEIHGATLGIIGLGQIGLEMAKRARGFE